MNATELSQAERVRYSRHLVLPEVGEAGQARLKQAAVLIVGAGGLGSPAALYLAAAGVGRIGMVDFDTVDRSNLQRQILHGESDVGRAKLASARDRLAQINPHVRFEPHETRLGADNALAIVRQYDVVLDGADNFATRYLVNDACVLLRKPDVHGSVLRFAGQASVFWAGHGPCYRCLFPEPPPAGLVPDCAAGGVLGVLPGIVGAIQAAEAVKLILGRGEPLVGRMLLLDALTMRFRELKARRDPACPVCGDAPTIMELTDEGNPCDLCAATGGETEAMNQSQRLTPRELKAALDRGEDLLLLDVREPFEHDLGHLPGCCLIPLGQLEARLGELGRNARIVAYCKAGGRSLRAADLLRAHGFADVRDLEGGILAWSDQIDPSIPKY